MAQFKNQYDPLMWDLKSQDDLDRQNALRHIVTSLSTLQQEIPNLIRSGVVDILLSMLTNDNESPYLQTLAVWSLSNIALHDLSHPAMLSDIVLNTLITFLAHSYNVEVNIKCLAFLTNLSTTEKNREVLNRKGVVKLLTAMIKHDPSMIPHISRALRNLLLDLGGQKTFAVDCSGIVVLINILNQSPPDQIVAEILSILITLCVTTDLMRKIVTAAGALTPLVYLLKNHDNDDLLDLTLKTLITLSLTTENEVKLLHAGAVFMVIDILNLPKRNKILEQATLLLSNISCNEEIQKSLRYCGLVRPLIHLIKSTDPGLQIQSARLITNLSLDDWNRLELLDAGAREALELQLSNRNRDVVDACQLALGNLSIPVSDEAQYEMIHQYGLEPEEEDDLSIKPRGSSLGIPGALLAPGPTLNSSLSSPMLMRNSFESPGSLSPRSPSVHTPPLNELNSPTVRVRSPASLNVPPNLENLLAAPKGPEDGKKSKLRPASTRISGTPKVKTTTPIMGLKGKTNVPDLGARGVRRALREEEKYTLRRKASVLHPQLLRREKISNELLQTEKSYVESLKLVVDLFLKPIMDSIIKANSPSDGILPEADAKSIFSVVEVIYKINAEFLASLQKSMLDFAPAITKVAELAIPLTQKLKHYSRYIINYDNLMNTYSTCIRTQPKFAELVTSNREKPEMKGLDLLSLLIMPVQRIPRYIMLFEDMLKNTNNDHPDYPSVQEVLRATKETANFLNEAKRKAENTTRVVKIQETLSGGVEIVKEGRSFVREGTVVLHTKKGSEYAHFFLLTDILLHTVQKKQKFKVHSTVPLSELTVVDVADTPDLKNAMKFSWPSHKEVITLSVSTQTEKNMWIKDLKDVVEKFKKE
eukprot:TRINITY_DN6766_c0_g1_i1.p1 TRINITY_DN6766_c0_g1~~TRINITY_DN6766_c0_g1_i1.p1  ORF type:complete len:874 (-),score=290.31 TRINITY_DN6766_c0_g1_i1:43-2664(-)